MKPLICLIALLGLAQLYFAQDRTPDPTFNSSGHVIRQATGDQDGESVLVQPDGKILIAGAGDNGNDYDLLLTRYLPNGSVDVGFGANGSVALPIGTSDEVLYSVILQPDGKIIGAGAAIMPSDIDMIAIRLLSDGSLDSSFGGNGTVIVDFGNGDDVAHGVVIQTDGKLVLGGFADDGNQLAFALARLLPNGNPDSTFSGNGKSTFAIGAIEDVGESLALQSDGKILLGGTSEEGNDLCFALARFLPDGSPDITFNGTGKSMTNLGMGNDEGRSLAVQSNGKIILAGITDNGTDNDFALVSYLSTGKLDSSFNQTGILTVDLNGGDDYCTSVVFDQDGDILAGGDSNDGQSTQFALLDVHPTGTLDTSLNQLGWKTFALRNTEDLCNDLILQPDGRIIMAGESDAGSGESDMAILRLDTAMMTGMAPQFHLELELKCYPNPFAEQVTLEYELPSTLALSIKLYNTMGVCVKILEPNRVHNKGKHVHSLKIGPQLPSGIYFLALEGEERLGAIKVAK
jgi:uncharacterized delta-60 repeat protein